MSIDKWRDKQKVVHPTLASHSAMKGDEVLIPAMTRMACENVMLNNRSQTQKTTYYMIPIIRGAQNKQIYRDRKQKLGVGRMGMTANGYRLRFRGNEHVLKLNSGGSCKAL